MPKAVSWYTGEEAEDDSDEEYGDEEDDDEDEDEVHLAACPAQPCHLPGSTAAFQLTDQINRDWQPGLS